MSSDDNTKVKCPTCGKSFRWKPEHSGKKVRCSGCEAVFRMPVDAPAAPTEDTYELDVAELPKQPESAAAPAQGEQKPRCPSCGNALRPGAVICVNCGYNLKEGRKLTTEIADEPAESESTDDKDAK